MLSRIRRGLRLTRPLIPVLVLLVVAAAVLMAVALAQTHPEVAGVSVTLVPDTGDMAVDSTGNFDVLVSPNGVGNIAAAQFGIRFDPNALEVLSVTPNAAVLGIPLGAPDIDNVAGTAFFGAFTFPPLLPANQQPFRLAAIQFRAKADRIPALSIDPPGGVTDVIFEVDLDRKTAVVDGTGDVVLEEALDYLAATITLAEAAPPGLISAVIVAPDAGTEGSPVTFDASQSVPTTGEQITSFAWDFGDDLVANFISGDHA